MQVVSNTSPISYLVLIEEDHILPGLFGTVVIPEAVEEELTHPASPQRLHDWMAEPPSSHRGYSTGIYRGGLD